MNATQIILLVLCVLVLVTFVVWQIAKVGLRKFIINAIVYAEKTFNDNEIKFNSVVDKTISKLPLPLNLIPTSFVENLVQTIFDEIKIALDYKEEEE